MTVDNRVQFAVVREDPDIERALLDSLANARHALLVASGGCTAFTLAVQRPHVMLTLVDSNAAQLDLIEQKLAALKQYAPGSTERARLFAVDAAALSSCGNFESLFRALQNFLDDLVMPRPARTALLTTAAVTNAEQCARLIGNKYWPAAFEMFFADALLEAMFGSEATQHAPRGSYPGYFRGVFERGLAREDAASNYFLHHALLGGYVEAALPAYLSAPCDARFTMLQCELANAPSFANFDLLSLSNVFDWMPSAGVQAIAARLCQECTPGSVVLVRQLNNRAPIEALMRSAFLLDETMASDLHARDRSLFYERLLVLRKT